MVACARISSSSGSNDLCQDFGHGIERNHAAIGIASGLGSGRSKKAGLGSVRSKKSAMLRPAPVAYRGMRPPPVVVRLDELDDCVPGLGPGGESPAAARF